MAMRGSISGNSGNIGGVSTKNTGNVFSGTTDGYWKRGMSAYELAVHYGYKGTQEEWLASLHGKSVTIASVYENDEYAQITFSDGNSFKVRHGGAITFKVTPDNKIYWRYVNEDPNDWKLMVDIQSIVNNEFDMRATNYANLYYNTKEGWDSMPNLISELGAIYYYQDYIVEKDNDGNVISTKPGIKIGDGLGYVRSLPFIGDLADPINNEALENHINNQSIHVTNEERMFWNNKCRVDDTLIDNENLIFTIN